MLHLPHSWASLLVQSVKNLIEMLETVNVIRLVSTLPGLLSPSSSRGTRTFPPAASPCLPAHSLSSLGMPPSHCTPAPRELSSWAVVFAVSYIWSAPCVYYISSLCWSSLVTASAVPCPIQLGRKRCSSGPGASRSVAHSVNSGGRRIRRSRVRRTERNNCN